MTIPIVFAGTPDFAVPTLKQLHSAEAIEIRGVIARPDKPRGRKKRLEPGAVKAQAMEMGYEVFQPAGLKKPEVLPWLEEKSPEVIVVVAYGGMVPPHILSFPKYGCLNLHPSLLPKYRGAGPIQWSIINGDEVTGICTMHMSEGWDDGDVIYRQETPIDPDEDAGDLHDRLAVIGAELMERSILEVAAGTAPREVQDESQVIWAPKIEPEHEILDWSKSAQELNNLIRGLSPAPGAHTTLNGKRLKVFLSEVMQNTPSASPGTVYDTSKGTIRVATGQGGLELLEIQPDGKRRMRAHDYLRGHTVEPGTVLGK